MKTEFPLPDFEFEPTRGFWQAAQDAQLVIPRCESCEHWNWYPPEQCRNRGGKSLLWTRVSGRARLFSYSEVRRALFKQYATKAPYLTGLVALEEDPAVRLVTLFTDCSPGDLELDMPMQVAFRTLEFPDVEGSVLVPMFKPV